MNILASSVLTMMEKTSVDWMGEDRKILLNEDVIIVEKEGETGSHRGHWCLGLPSGHHIVKVLPGVL